MERYLTMNALNYISSEIHANFGPLFGPLSEEEKNVKIEKLNNKFAYLQNNMLKKQFLVGDKFSIADIYLYFVLGWTRDLNIDISALLALKPYMERIGELKVVVDAKAKMASNPNTI